MYNEIIGQGKCFKCGATWNVTPGHYHECQDLFLERMNKEFTLDKINDEASKTISQWIKSTKSVRIATIDDAAFISFFQTLFAKEYNEDSSNIVKGVLNTLENKTPQKSLYLISTDVDENGEAPTGCLRISYRFSDWRNKSYLYIDGVFVLKEFRKQGFLNLLLNKCKEIAIQNDCDRMTLFVEDTNIIAQTAYKNFGFKEGREWEYIL